MSKIIVTGGAGFIGSHMTDLLISKGHEVVILDNLSSGKKSNINKKAKFHKVDILNLKKIKPLFKGVDYVFHMAAMARIQPSIIDPAQSIENNILGTTNVLIAARDAKVKKVIYSASSSFYGDQKYYPLYEEMIGDFKNPYSLSKYVGEELCKLFTRLYGLKTVSLRYFNVYGKRQLTEGAYSTVVGIFLRQIRDNEPITIVGNGSIRRDFTHVSDIVRANFLAMKKGNGSINLGTGTNYSINRIGDILLKEFLGISLKEALKIKKAIYIPKRPGESKITIANNDKAKNILDWHPSVIFDEGIKEL